MIEDNAPKSAEIVTDSSVSVDSSPKSAENAEIPLKTGQKKGINPELQDEKGRILPGKTLNPNGKAKGTRHFTTLLKNALDKIQEQGDVDPLDVAIIKQIAWKARRGDEWAIDTVIDRIDGKVSQTLVHETDPLNNLSDEQKMKLNKLLGVDEPALIEEPKIDDKQTSTEAGN